MNDIKLEVLLNYCLSQKHQYDKLVWIAGWLGVKPPTKLKYDYYNNFYTAYPDGTMN